LGTPHSGERPLVLVNLSGRGDKDVDTAIKWFGLDTTGTASESDSGPER
jgi:tryptophan synthase beta chain